MKKEKHNISAMKSIIFDGKKLESNIDGTQIYFDGKLLNQTLLTDSRWTRGFLQCSVNGTKMYVHRIVALIYVPNPDNYQKVCHLDTNTLNNHYKNLAWGDSKLVSQNMKVAGRLVGQESKLPKSDIQMIVSRLENGEFSRTIAKEYCTSDMSLIRLKKRFKITTNCSNNYDEYFKQFVKEYLIAGNTIDNTLKLFNLQYHTLWRWNKEWKLTLIGKRPRLMSENTISDIKRMYHEDHLKIDYIAEKLGVSYSSVYKYI